MQQGRGANAYKRYASCDRGNGEGVARWLRHCKAAVDRRTNEEGLGGAVANEGRHGRDSECAVGRAFSPGLQVANLRPLERLESWDIPDRDVSLQEQACAALFAFTVIEFSLPRAIGTQKQIDALTKRFQDAAMINRSVRAYAAADLIEDQLPLGGSPYIVNKPSGKRGHDDEVRAGARALAAAMHRIFGSFKYRTVATVVMVAGWGSMASASRTCAIGAKAYPVNIAVELGTLLTSLLNLADSASPPVGATSLAWLHNGEHDEHQSKTCRTIGRRAGVRQH